MNSDVAFLSSKNYFSNIKYSENKDGVDFTKVCSIFFYKKTGLFETLKNTSGNNLNNMYIPKDNAISQHSFFIKECISEVKSYTKLKDDQEELLNTSSEVVNLEEFMKACYSSLDKKLDKIASSVGISVINHNFKIEEDLKKHKIKIENKKTIPSDFDCVRYALHKLQDPDFKDFTYKSNSPNPFNGGVLNTLTRHGYKIVTS